MGVGVGVGGEGATLHMRPGCPATALRGGGHQASGASGIIRHHQASSGIIIRHIIRHYQASSGIIIRHHQASPGSPVSDQGCNNQSINHQASSGIIRGIRHHQASSGASGASGIIRHHQASPGIIIRHHQASPGITRHHQASSGASDIIRHHQGHQGHQASNITTLSQVKEAEGDS